MATFNHFLALRPSLAEIDLGDWLDCDPRQLRALSPDWLDHPAADRALRYGRGHGDLDYEQILLRTQCALPAVPAIALQTRSDARFAQESDAAHRHDAEFDGLIDQISCLRHRPIDLPLDGDARLRFEVGDGSITVHRAGDDGIEEPWTFSLSHPPRVLLTSTSPAEPVLIASQGYRMDLAGVFWLPFECLIEQGTFARFQETREALVAPTRPRCFYLFLSHRWLSATHPDREGEQAKYFAWQFVAALCEAIEIAAERGLHEPRLRSVHFRVPIDRFGSELAESLLVNVLRTNLNEAEVQSAVREIDAFGARLDDRGFAAAESDRGLGELRRCLVRMPILRELLRCCFVWYDYSCMPQAPRSADDEALFRDGLSNLNNVQIMGATAVLLDDVEDYLGRGWCVLETVAAEELSADSGACRPHLLAASRRSTNRSGKVEHYYETLLSDCRHLVWRGILDTELFESQSPERCMQRLGLSVTEPGDLPIVYRELLRYRGPDAPTDDCEVVTGVFPLPFVADGSTIHWRTETMRAVAGDVEPESVSTVDAIRCGRIELNAGAEGHRPDLAPIRVLLPGGDAQWSREALEGLHIAVVGGCEGEAILVADWIDRHHAALEDALGRAVASISWLASDIAPVGWMSFGQLLPAPVYSLRWLVVATRYRLRGCEVAGHLLEMCHALGRPYGELAINETRDNLRWYPGRDVVPPHANLAEYRITEQALRPHRGGLFRGALLEHLLPRSERLG